MNTANTQLIYVCIYGETYIKYFKLLYESLVDTRNLHNTDVLIITDEETSRCQMLTDILQSQKSVLLLVVDEENPYFARYLLFRLPTIYNYVVAFYLDCDILFHRNASSLWKEVALLDSDIWVVKRLKHTVVFGDMFGSQMMTRSNILAIKECGYCPINSGQFLFHITSNNERHMDEIYSSMLYNNKQDQPYLNYYIVANRLKVDYTILDKYCHLRLLYIPSLKEVVAGGDELFTHFAGFIENKYEYIVEETSYGQETFDCIDDSSICKKTITIISEIRSGTTYMNTFLSENFTNIKQIGEIFNKDFLGRYDLKDDYVKYLHNIKKYRPIHFYNEIIKLQPKTKDIIVAKIFSGHLCGDMESKPLQHIMNTSNLIIFMYRNYIDIYISYLKATETGVWKNYDTTNMKIVFDRIQYEKYKSKLTKWFSTTKKYVVEQRLPFTEIDYDQFHSFTYEEQYTFISSILEKHFHMDVSYELNPIFTDNSTLHVKKQDMSISYSDKIENYDDVADYIETELIEYKKYRR